MGRKRQHGSDWLDRLLDASLVGYTRLGPRMRRHAPIEDRLDGRVAVVTGATSGLGLAAAHGLAALGAKLVLVGRNDEKLAAACAAVRARCEAADVDSERADFIRLGEVVRLAERLASRPVSLLVNNAGVLLNEKVMTADGLEQSFAVNLVSHFILTNALLPTLQEQPTARIVNVSSGGMYSQRLDLRVLQGQVARFDGVVAYAQAKRAQVIVTQRWGEQLRDTAVHVHAMHPGWADTPGVERSLPRFHKLLSPVLRTPAQGADTIVWLCAAAEPGRSQGLFWHDRQPRPIHRGNTRESEADRQALWDLLSEISSAPHAATSPGDEHASIDEQA